MKNCKLLIVLTIAMIGVLILSGCPPRADQPSPQPMEEDIVEDAQVEITPVGLFEFPGNWDEIDEAAITLFYPGQASWQWLTSDNHPGKDGLLGGTGCRTCHENQQQKLGQSLVAGGQLEDDPIRDKEPTKDVDVRAAYDDEFLYIRYQWESEEPGATHTLWRFDGNEWVGWGGPKPDVAKGNDNRPASYEDRVTMLIDDMNIPAFDGADVGFKEAGCFITCHNSMRAMPLEPSQEEVQNDPYFGRDGLDRKDIRKYLLISRTETDETGGWDKPKSADEIASLKSEGMFLDLWQWRAARSNPLGYAGDDFVLDYRNFDEGKQPFTTPGELEWMYNEEAKEFNAIPEDELSEKLNEFPLIIDDPESATEFDPDADFSEGDILPKPVLRQPEGSSADVQANGHYQDGIWTVELRRKLETGNEDDKALVDGEIYTIGIGVFDDHVSNRRHFVSFPTTLGLGVEADIQAVMLE